MSEWRYDENSGAFRRYENYGGGGPRKNGNEWISWGMITFMFLLGLWPIGLFMLIAKLNDSTTTTRRTTTTTTKRTTAAPAQNRVKTAATSMWN